MLFHTIDFAIFLPLIFLFYWIFGNKNHKRQNLVLLIASFIFYSWWDWRFLSLILMSTTVDYLVCINLVKERNFFRRKILLRFSVIFNIGILFLFKYFNFFITNFVDVFKLFGLGIQVNTLNIILPLGISFYTFQTISYTIDVYNKKIKPTKDYFAFSTFVCFFPQLVAGPIERASNLLPQFLERRRFNYLNAVNGLRQILWGLFKKIVIADNCGLFSDMIFENYTNYNGTTLILGAIMFAIQIYTDFSGYSDIAIGTSRLFGISLKQNFAFPYFSRNILEFWKKWHISLTSWLTDYVFTPIAIKTRHYDKKGIIVSIFITFLISGLWHGANWTFVIWGLFHALIYLITLLIRGNKPYKNVVANYKLIPSFKELILMISTFSLVSFSYIFFRSNTINHSLNYINRLIEGLFKYNSLLETFDFIYWNISISFVLVICFFVTIEWLGRRYEYAIEKTFLSSKRIVRILFYYSLILMIFQLSGEEKGFIYFQF